MHRAFERKIKRFLISLLKRTLILLLKVREEKPRKEEIPIVNKDETIAREYTELIEALVLISMVAEKLAKKVIRLNQVKKEESNHD